MKIRALNSGVWGAIAGFNVIPAAESPHLWVSVVCGVLIILLSSLAEQYEN